MRDFATDGGGLGALALNTATLGHNLEGFGAGWSPEAVIDACAARGFGGMTFWRRELGGRAYGAGGRASAVSGRAYELGRRVRAAGMQVTGLCRTPYITGRGAGTGDAIKESVEVAAALGAGVLTVVTGGTEPGTKGVLESQKILAERLAGVVDFAAAHGVRLALEPLNPMFGGNRTCIMSVRDALNVCEMIGSMQVGIAVDVYHVWWDAALEAHLSAAKGRIMGYHLCDWLEDTSDMLLDRGMMGDGVADLKAIRGWVEAAGYDGACEVEIFSAGDWWRRPPGEVLDTIVERFRTVC